MTRRTRVYSLILLVPLTFSIYLFRMGFAQTVLVYGIYWFLIKNRKKGLFFIIFAVLIHISYMPFVFIAIASRYKIFNFSTNVFCCLCFLLVLIESSSLGVTLLRSLPFFGIFVGSSRRVYFWKSIERFKFSIYCKTINCKILL